MVCVMLDYIETERQRERDGCDLREGGMSLM